MIVSQKPIEIINILTHSDRIKTFYLKLKDRIKVIPGQFMMVWIPGAEEVPISISYFNGSIMGLTIAAVGETTRQIHELKIHDYLYVRGPYGNGFKIPRGTNKTWIIGGGYGIAPLLLLAKKVSNMNIKVISFLGARNKDELLFYDQFKLLGEVFVSTDDGSEGFHGDVTTLVEKYLSLSKVDLIYTCGPEVMITKLIKLAYDHNLNLQASLERLIKCGIGLCGSCCLDPLGLRVCKDGPVFPLKILVKLSELGRYRRSPSGVKVKLSD
ncbi:MAG: dihydroorotate dehydrogenase electron transfer subunit [Candidatus Methanomethylicia archaeon]